MALSPWIGITPELKLQSIPIRVRAKRAHNNSDALTASAFVRHPHLDASVRYCMRTPNSVDRARSVSPLNREMKLPRTATTNARWVNPTAPSR